MPGHRITKGPPRSFTPELSGIKLAATLLPSPVLGHCWESRSWQGSWGQWQLCHRGAWPKRGRDSPAFGLGGCCAHRPVGKQEAGRGSPTVCVDVTQLVVQVEETAQAARAAAGRPVAGQHELIELQVWRRASPIQKARPVQERHGLTHCGQPETLGPCAPSSVALQRWEPHPDSPPGCPVALRWVSTGSRPACLARCARASLTPPQRRGSWPPSSRSSARPVPRRPGSTGKLPPASAAAGLLAAARRTGAAGRRRGRQAPPRLSSPPPGPRFARWIPDVHFARTNGRCG